jgi:hypothetical protein
MATLATLADEAQILLSDSGAATWAQATIEGWINAAIRDYSQHFPREVTDTITTTADTRKYDLPANFLDMLSVEYPTGEDPPEYLSRLPFNHRDFWGSDYFYDVVKHEDTGDVAELWISKKPAASETVTYIYQASHDHALDPSDTVTVPSHHHNLLILFVFWKANQELLSAEQQAPTSNSSLLMGQLASNMDRAKRTYYATIAQALRAIEGQSRLLNWHSDEEIDHIY